MQGLTTCGDADLNRLWRLSRRSRRSTADAGGGGHGAWLRSPASAGSSFLIIRRSELSVVRMSRVSPFKASL